ncbi:MAG: CDP-alcohol phosphatidyltransferase family protein [Chloroflexi bacterium]|nr:CDP-alcohol phosphatidyltransferase family protein [Chloroflexota bacterium]
MNTVVSGQKKSTAKSSGLHDVAAHRFTLPVVRLLAKTSITPSQLTVFGFLLAVVAAVLIGTGHLFTAGLVMLLAGFFDMVDGALARYNGQATRFGGILDSTLDRLSESALLIGVLVLYAGQQPPYAIILVSLALVSSLLVSYIRARAEGAGLKGKAGLFTRTERVVVLVLGLLLSQFEYALLIAVGIIALLSFITAGHRLFSVWQETRGD